MREATAGPTAAPASWPRDTRGRIMKAAVQQCEEFGLRRTTMDDVARRAGLSRATLYRHFESKDALVQAVILAEAERFFFRLDVALEGLSTSDERLIEGFTFALHYVRRHALLGKLLRTEPEALLPYLLGDSQLIPIATEAVAARIPGAAGGGAGGRAGVNGAGGPADSEDARSAAELIVRLVLSLALSPESALGIEDPEGARRLAQRYLVAGFTPR